MTDHSSSTFSSRRFPAAVLIAVLAGLLIELAVVTLRPGFAGALDYTVQAKLRLLADSSHGDDVVIFGDSRFFSIDPALVEQALGGDLTVTNYSWPFAGAEMIEFMLDAYLHSKPPPRLILVGWMPENLAVPADRLTAAADPLYQTRLFTALPAIPLTLSLARARQGRLFWASVEHRLMPPSAHHRERLAAWALGEADPSPDEQRIHESYRRTGSFLLYDQETAPSDAVASYERAVGGFAPLAAVPNTVPWRRFLEQASSKAVPVVLFNVPIPKSLHQRYEELGVIAEYRRLIVELTHSFENFQVVEPLTEIYPNDYFADVGHLNTKGDRAYLETYPTRLAKYAPLAPLPIPQPEPRP